MVDTRSQKSKKMASNSQARSNHVMKDTVRDATLEYMEKVLVRMESLENSWNQEVDSLTKEREAISKVKEELEGLRTQHDELKTNTRALNKTSKALEEAKDEISVLKRAVRHNSGIGVPHVKVKELESYDGTRSVKTLGNFLWDMEQYLERLGLPDGEAQVKVVAQFLTNDAKMWWRRRVDQMINGNADDITSWEDMKKTLQTHFSPQDETWEASKKINFIKQAGSLQAYQREFSSAALELPDMAERDKVFNFIIGLNPWARNEVKRQKIRTLEEAFTAIDRLVDHYDETSNEKKKSDKPKEKKKDDASEPDDNPKEKKPLKCWLCAGPHVVKNCPSKPKVAVVAQSDEDDNASVGMMQILGASATTEVTSRRDPERNRLEYVQMKVGEAEVITMVDSRASHNFMSEDTARRLGLKFVPV
eukprot:PITA_10563